jgi:hypothetical protein
MQLNPVGQPSIPSYPVRTGKETTFTRWVRRALAAACATGAIWAAGCYGSTGVGGDDPRPDDPTFTEIVEVVLEQPVLPENPEPMDGGMMAPAFTCGPVSEWYTVSLPGWLDGSLCGDEAAMAQFEVTTAGRYQIELSSGGEFVFLSVQDTAGEQIVELTPDATLVDVELPAGLGFMVATAADPMDNPNAWFTVNVYGPF